MWIKMSVGMSGTHNGLPYPPVGQAVEVEDSFGVQLCRKGLATAIAARPTDHVETAILPQTDVEPRRGGLTTAKARAAARQNAEES